MPPYRAAAKHTEEGSVSQLASESASSMVGRPVPRPGLLGMLRAARRTGPAFRKLAQPSGNLFGLCSSASGPPFPFSLEPYDTAEVGAGSRMLGTIGTVRCQHNYTAGIARVTHRGARVTTTVLSRPAEPAAGAGGGVPSTPTRRCGRPPPRPRVCGSPSTIARRT